MAADRIGSQNRNNRTRWANRRSERGPTMLLYVLLTIWAAIAICAVMAMVAFNRRIARESKERIEWARQMQAVCEELGGERAKRIGVMFTGVG